MTSSVGGKYSLHDDRWEPLKTIHRIIGLDCRHPITTYAWTVGGCQIKEVCVECGQSMSDALPFADHPSRDEYPSRFHRTYLTRELTAEKLPEHARAEVQSVYINECTDTGGGELLNLRVWDSSCVADARSIMLLWNPIVHRALAGVATKEIIGALQFGLRRVDVVSCDDEDDMNDAVVEMSISFDAQPYLDQIVVLLKKHAKTLKRLEIVRQPSVYGDENSFGTNFTYEDYLKSGHWAERKLEAMSWPPNHRSSLLRTFACESPSCRDGAVVQCHHLTYVNAGHEQPGDLVFLCRSCHENAEFMKRIARPQEISLP